MAHPAHRLLLLEDDPALQQILCWHFEDLGYQVTAVSDCESALQNLRQQHYDVALMDYQLPDGNSLDHYPQFKRAQPNLPTIMMSAVADFTVAASAIATGIFAFEAKPVNPEKLEKTVHAALLMGH